MNYKSKLFSLPAILFLSISIHAQTAHNLSPNSICKYVKGKKNFEGMAACNACSEEGKKNQAAIEAEYKRKVAANETAQAQALKKLQQEQVKRNEARKAAIEKQSKNVVTFALPKTENKPKTQPAAASVDMKAGNLYTAWGPLRDLSNADNYSRDYGFVLNAKGDTILRRDDLFYEFFAYGLKMGKDFREFPGGIVVSKLKIKAKCRSNPGKDCSPVWDILNAKGQRLLNDNNVVGIAHIVRSFFLVVYGPCDGRGYFGYSSFAKAAIYNTSDKTFFWLEDQVSYKGESSMEVSHDVSRSPKLAYGWEALDSWNENMKTNGITDYVMLKTGSHYPAKNAVYYITNNGKIAKKVFETNGKITSQVY